MQKCNNIKTLKLNDPINTHNQCWRNAAKQCQVPERNENVFCIFTEYLKINIMSSFFVLQQTKRSSLLYLFISFCASFSPITFAHFSLFILSLSLSLSLFSFLSLSIYGKHTIYRPLKHRHTHTPMPFMRKIVCLRFLPKDLFALKPTRNTNRAILINAVDFLVHHHC